MLFRAFLFTAVLFCFPGNMEAQAPHLYFERLTKQNGLSHNKVNCFLQDKRGFMWIGTEDGLNRYDGGAFVVFRHQPGNPSSISGNIITDMVEDEAQRLWIATADGGLTRYDFRLPPARQFKQYRHVPTDTFSIPSNIINTLIDDPQGYLWLGTGGKGVWRFNKRTEQFDQPVEKGMLGILDLCMDHNGVIWTGRQGGGLQKIGSRDLSYQADPQYADLYAKQLPHITVTALFNDHNRYMWYGSWDKALYRFNPFTGKEDVFRQNNQPDSFLSDEIISFAEDRDGLLWLGGSSKGLQLYDPRQQRFYHYRYNASLEGTISDDRINCIYRDRQGVIWLGTNKGINVNHPVLKQFEQIFLPPVAAGDKKRATIYDFFRDKQDDLWIGTNNGIYIYPHGSSAFRHIPLQYKGNPLSVTKFFPDTDSTFYLGTNYSLFRFNPSSYQLTLLPNTEKDLVMNKIIQSRVVSIVRDTIDGHPVLLVSPYGHYLAYYDLTAQRWVSRLDTTRKILRRFNLVDNLIRKVFKSRSGKIWLATAKTGLGDWLKHPLPRVQYFNNDSTAPGAISNNHVYDLAEDRQGNLWVSTYGGGLNYFNIITGRFSHIAETENLLEGIQTDKKGHVWMVSNGDLHKYDPEKRLYFSYKLPDVEKSGGISGLIHKDNNGRMCVAGSGYFIEFDPDVVINENQQPEIFFTDLKIFNTSFSHLLMKDKITLRHHQNYFRIEFAAPYFSPARHVRYANKLEGWDQDWVETGNEHFAQFSNLKGGEYIFKVKASNGQGVWSEKIASLRIVIVPPFWDRWQFYVMLVILIIGAMAGIYLYRVNELLKRQAIRNKIAQDLHDNVGSTLSSIAVYSRVAKIYTEKQQLDALKSTIDKISDTAGEMITEMNDIVWAINPRNDNMNTILQRMEFFARPLLASQNISFHFEAPDQIRYINLGMTRRKNFYLIYREAVNNVLKYAGCRNLWVKVELRHHYLEMTVQDDGKGFDLQQVQKDASRSLSGNGLHNMQMRAAEIKGVLTISSTPGVGTTIHLRFPIG